ncbi:DUF177 domain-containing protein [Leptolyngbya sp. FACHB-261]|uniref:YceD family protein n=1 Tax=Leptolyngbya sp. FACHB-261 TaxID=2692806 RepID=UPI001689C830|nr:YceD family protein [Leptolyngbya sp. FACHB-261]MBD2103851.1 DUF177 domain-containing protein [Leptolyngbya sp. FACHB-261]
MELISLTHLLRAPQATEVIRFKELLPHLESLIPVQGEIKVVHQGSYLEVSGQAETIVTLSCDRCLQQYNYRLSVTPSELIWLTEPEDALNLPQEREVPIEDLIESLPPNGSFDPAAWIYEHLCLGLPLRQICGEECPGTPLDAPQLQEASEQSVKDGRWAALEQLKGKFSLN